MINIDYDVLIIGDGPAGMSAGIFTSSEGLPTLIVGQELGGQSSHTNLIENYYGFPNGISGLELSNQGKAQATRLGANFRNGKIVKVVSRTSNQRLIYDVMLKNSDTNLLEVLTVKAILVANGLIYRPLKCKGNDLPCVHYLPTQDNLAHMRDKSVAVVGGGNSAGQAALHLCNDLNCKVALVIKGNDLSKDMSEYLVNEIYQHPNIEVLNNFDLSVIEMKGDKARVIGNCDCNTLVDYVCVYIGMMPEESFLPSSVKLDEKGFVVVDFKDYSTSAKGIFAAGDCHQAARDRIAASVGEGSIAARSIHEYVNEWNKPTKIEQVINLLKKVEEDHREYEVKNLNGQKDEFWYQWYADNMIAGLATIYSKVVQYAQIVEWLEQADKDAQKANVRDWITFYAEFIDKQITQPYEMLSNFATPGGNYLENDPSSAYEFAIKENLCQRMKKQIDMYA